MKKESIATKLQEIRRKLGKVIICQLGVREDGIFDILTIKTAVPFEELGENPDFSEATKKISDSKTVLIRSYIN